MHLFFFKYVEYIMFEGNWLQLLRFAPMEGEDGGRGRQGWLWGTPGPPSEESPQVSEGRRRGQRDEVREVRSRGRAVGLCMLGYF